MRLRTFLKPLSFIPAILLMYMIYSFSAQEGELSSSISYKASYQIVKAADYLLDTQLDEWQIADYATRIHGVTRKLAHMTEYFLLAVAVSFPLYVYGLHGILLLIVAGTFCLAFACADEYHQSFVAGRAASGKDVVIDGIGIFIGILLVRIIGWTGRHTLFRPVEDDGYRRLSRREMKKIKRRQKQIEKDMQIQNRRYYEQEQRLRRERREEKKAARPGYTDPRSSTRISGDTRPYGTVSDETRAYNIRRSPDRGGREFYDERPSDAYGERLYRSYDERLYDERLYDEPPYDEPSYDEPPYDEPSYDEPPYDEPPYDNRRPSTADELDTDMPFSRFLSRRKK